MTRRRWIADEFSADRAVLTGAHAAHLARTLRARVGQEFEVACGDVVRLATVSRVADDRVEFTLGEEVSRSNPVPITLLLAIFKFDRMEWAIEKCTELNVNTIVPVIARRTEKHLVHAADKRVERWRRIAREASEQSRRATPPEIRLPMKLKDALAAIPNTTSAVIAAVGTATARTTTSVVIPTEGFGPSGGTCGSPEGGSNDKSSFNVSPGARRPTEPRSGGSEVSPGREPWVGSPLKGRSPVGTTPNLNLVLAETERDILLMDVLRSNSEFGSLAIAIGPEGGWTPEELHIFAAGEFIACSLGETILRAETAAIAALAIARLDLQAT